MLEWFVQEGEPVVLYVRCSRLHRLADLASARASLIRNGDVLAQVQHKDSLPLYTSLRALYVDANAAIEGASEEVVEELAYIAGQFSSLLVATGSTINDFETAWWSEMVQHSNDTYTTGNFGGDFNPS